MDEGFGGEMLTARTSSLQRAGELVELHVVQIRHRPEGYAAARPVPDMEAANGAAVQKACADRLFRPDEHIDRVWSARVDQRGGRPTRDVVQPASCEREPDRREGTTGGEK